MYKRAHKEMYPIFVICETFQTNPSTSTDDTFEDLFAQGTDQATTLSLRHGYDSGYTSRFGGFGFGLLSGREGVSESVFLR